MVVEHLVFELISYILSPNCNCVNAVCLLGAILVDNACKKSIIYMK